MLLTHTYSILSRALPKWCRCPRAPYGVINLPARPPCRPARPGEVPRRIEAPGICNPLGPVAPNPCIPIYPHCNYKKYKCIAYMVCFPVIFVLMVRLMFAEEEHHATPCLPYEYLNIRTKRFPWGDGTKSLIWNEKVNWAREDCDELDVAEICE